MNRTPALMLTGIVLVMVVIALLMLNADHRATGEESTIAPIIAASPPPTAAIPSNLNPQLLQLCQTLADDPLAIEALADGNANLRSVADYDLAMIEEGAVNYSVFCANCHGVAAEGVDVLGPPLVQNVFVRGVDDAALVRFVIHGRSADDPFNISGVTMPARAGFPNLSDAQIESIIVYLRVLDVQTIAEAQISP